MPAPPFACFILAAWWFPVQGIGPTAASNDVGFGPISTRNGRVVCLPFMRFVPRADFLEKGQISLESSIQVINDVRRDPEDLSKKAILFEDQETQRLALLYSRGIGKGMEGSMEIPLLFRNGGFMDPIINFWHNAILPPSDRVRNHLEFGKCFVTIPGVGTFQSAGGLGDVSFMLRKRLGPHFVLAAGVKAPTGTADALLGSGAFDCGANIEYRTTIRRKLQFDASIGAVAQGRPTVLKHARGIVDQEYFAFTWKKNSRDAWIAQWQSESSPTIVGLASNDGVHRILTAGYERKLSASTRLDLYFQEDHDVLPGNAWLVNIAPDFTIGIRYVKRF